MSSRQEEKEQRKREREERELAAAKVAKRKRLLQILGGVVVGSAAIAGVALAIAGSGEKDKPDTADLVAAAKAAGCVVKEFKEQGRGHVDKKLDADDFDSNPATSGEHNITPAQDGVYAPDNEPEIQNWVHTLEHGRVLFMYKPGTPKGRIAQLQNLFNQEVENRVFSETPANGYHSVLMQNNSKMPFEVAAVAWQNYVGCAKFNDKSIAALSAFREVHVDQAPEQFP